MSKFWRLVAGLLLFLSFMVIIIPGYFIIKVLAISFCLTAIIYLSEQNARRSL